MANKYFYEEVFSNSLLTGLNDNAKRILETTDDHMMEFYFKDCKTVEEINDTADLICKDLSE